MSKAIDMKPPSKPGNPKASSKATPKAQQTEMNAAGFEHKINDACEEIAQDLAAALISKDVAQGIITGKRVELKQAMASESLSEYISFSDEDGEERIWKRSLKDVLTMSQPRKD